MIRFADKNDIPRLKELWRECFCEDGEFFFSRMFNKCLVFDDNGVSAMLHILEYECAGRPVYYLYGIGTCAKMRGKGIAAALIERAVSLARESCAAFVMLVPQGESLFDYYARFGFEKLCYRALPKHFEFSLKRAEAADIPKLNSLYESRCGDVLHIKRSADEWQIILDEGYDVFCGSDEYVISASGIILETNIACEYNTPTLYAAHLKLCDIELKNAYFNILHD